MVYTVPPSKRSLKQNVFEFELEEGGEVYTLPLLKYAPTGVVEKLSTITRESMKFTDLFLAFDSSPEAAAAVRQLDGEQLDALLAAYYQASGVTLPESSTSSAASTPTE